MACVRVYNNIHSTHTYRKGCTSSDKKTGAPNSGTEGNVTEDDTLGVVAGEDTAGDRTGDLELRKVQSRGFSRQPESLKASSTL